MTSLSWTLLPAPDAVAQRIRLGNMVSPVGYRNPAMMARMASTIDHISGERFLFGFGAGGCRSEYDKYGYDFEVWGLPKWSLR